MDDGKPKRTRVAAYGLIQEDANLLLCRIAPGFPNVGLWTLPGGGLDFGEDPEDGVVREVYEETGLEVRVRAIAGINSVCHNFSNIQMHGISILYHVDVVGGTLRFEVNGSTDRCEWHGLGNISGLEIVTLVEVALKMMEEGASP